MSNTSESVREDLESVGILSEDPKLKAFQAAYNIAKDLKSNPDWDKRTQQIAKKYFDLLHKAAYEKDRAVGAKEMLDQLRAERDAAESLAKVAASHIKFFKAALEAHRSEESTEESIQEDRLNEGRPEWPAQVQLSSQEVGGRVLIFDPTNKKKVIEVADMKTAKKLLRMRGYKPDSKSSVLKWSK
jgi:hypothetical protein